LPWQKAWQRVGIPIQCDLSSSGNGDEDDSPLRLISNMVSDEPGGGHHWFEAV
jgi:hypothetical protein